MGSGGVASGPEPGSEIVGQAADDAGDRLVELGVGQGPLVVAERQAVGQALVGLGERLAAVDVEEGDVAEQRAAVAPDGFLDRRGPGSRPGR